MKNTFLPIALFLSLGLLLNPASHADPSKILSNIQLAQAKSKSISAAAQSIKQRTGGRILSTKTVNKNGQRVYKIKVLLPSGRVKTFKVNAQ